MAHPQLTDAPANRRQWLILTVLCLAQFMVILDVTVVNVALPDIAADLRLDRAGTTWVITAYTVFFGGLLVLGGRLADLLGRRAVFLAGIAVFTAASLTAGFAGQAATLLTARAAQGLGAALMSPAALAIVTTTFTGAARHRALAVWGAIGGAGAAAGVLIGGLLVSGPGWHWIFFVNVPIGIAVITAVRATVAPGERRPGRLDVPGALLLTTAAGTLIYGLVRAGTDGFTAPGSWLPLAAAALLAVAVVIAQRAVRDPLLPRTLLTQRPVITGNLVMLAASGLLVAGFFATSMLVQHGYRYTPLETGLLFLPVTVATIAGAHLAGQGLRRFGARPVALTGFLVAAAGFALLTRTNLSESPLVAVLPGFLLAAAGLGAGFVTASVTVMTNIEHTMAGNASGLLNTGHELGAAVGVALASTIAAASLDQDPTAGITGFTDAYLAAAVAAGLAAVVFALVLPAGRPTTSDQPLMVH